MKERGLFFVLAVFVIFLAWPSASPGLPKTSAKDLSSTGLSHTLLVKSPAVGENWALKSKHDITWTSSHVTGYLRIDLYGDLPSPHKVGTITTNAAVSNGKYTWEAGKYLGGAVTEHGRNYRIVLTADNPSLTKSSPQFNLTVPSGQLNPVSSVTSGVKGLSFTYPRRGDGFHKGMRYTITWQSFNLNNARLKLELLDNDEVTLRQTIAHNFENKGKMDWDVPMTLPDAETFYKIRLQTMDGAQKAAVGPIKISKGAVLPASLKVTNPITGDKSFGDTIRVKWSSTAACSGNSGPRDAGFRIELIKLDDNNQEKIIAREMLTDQGFVFDNESPSGYLNWHWDWVIEPGSCQPGIYKIYVTRTTAKEGCDGYSQKFRILYAQERKSIELIGKRKICVLLHRCEHCSHDPDHMNLQSHDMAGIGDYPLVGYNFYYDEHPTNYDSTSFESLPREIRWFTVRSSVTFGDDPYWYKKIGPIQEAKLVLKRKWKAPYATTKSPALGGVGLETQSSGCENEALSGKVPVNASQVDNWEIDASAHYLALTNKGKPDYGVILYPNANYSTTCNNKCLRRDAENYEVILKVRFFDKKQ